MSSPTSSDAQKTLDYCFRRLQDTVTRDKLPNQHTLTTANQTRDNTSNNDGRGKKRKGKKGDDAPKNQPRPKMYCNVCKQYHGPECWLQYPEKAPNEWKTRYKDRIEAYQKSKKKDGQPSELLASSGSSSAKPTNQKFAILESTVPSIPLANPTVKSPKLYLDSYAALHVCKDRSMFITYTHGVNHTFAGFNGATSQVIGIGSIQFTNLDNEVITVHNVYYSPESALNIISKDPLVPFLQSLSFVNRRFIYKFTSSTLVTVMGPNTKYERIMLSGDNPDIVAASSTASVANVISGQSRTSAFAADSATGTAAVTSLPSDTPKLLSSLVHQ